MVEAARPSWAAIARRLSPSAFSTASHSRSSRRRCVPPDIAPSRIAVAGQGVTTTPRVVALHTGFRRLTLHQHKCYAHHLKEIGKALQDPTAQASLYLRELLAGAMAFKAEMARLPAAEV